MEGKKAAALCCLLMIVLSGQLQQVAAMSLFCWCYDDCYPVCMNEEHIPRALCIPKCIDDCIFKAEEPVYAALKSAGDCDGICRRPQSICGMAAPGADDVEACVNDCANNGGG